MKGVGGWWAAGVEPLPPTPPVLHVLTLTRLDLTRDYNDDVIGRSIYKERGDNDDETYMYVRFAVRQRLFEWLVLLIRPLLVGLDWPTARSVLLSHPSLPIEGEAVSAWFDRAWWADWPRLEMGLSLLGFVRALAWWADVPRLAEGLSVGAI